MITHTAIKGKIILSLCITNHTFLNICVMIDKEMLPTIFVVLFLVVHIIRSEVTGLNNFYAIKKMCIQNLRVTKLLM